MLINSTTIKDFMNTKALTQEEFAVKAGISRATVYGILYRGTAAISTVKKLAELMEVSPEDLARKTNE